MLVHIVLLSCPATKCRLYSIIFDQELATSYFAAMIITGEVKHAWKYNFDWLDVSQHKKSSCNVQDEIYHHFYLVIKAVYYFCKDKHLADVSINSTIFFAISIVTAVCAVLTNSLCHWAGAGLVDKDDGDWYTQWL